MDSKPRWFRVGHPNLKVLRINSRITSFISYFI
jgi:hypothetical protein